MDFLRAVLNVEKLIVWFITKIRNIETYRTEIIIHHFDFPNHSFSYHCHVSMTSNISAPLDKFMPNSIRLFRNKSRLEIINSTLDWKFLTSLCKSSLSHIVPMIVLFRPFFVLASLLFFLSLYKQAHTHSISSFLIWHFWLWFRPTNIHIMVGSNKPEIVIFLLVWNIYIFLSQNFDKEGIQETYLRRI